MKARYNIKMRIIRMWLHCVLLLQTRMMSEGKVKNGGMRSVSKFYKASTTNQEKYNKCLNDESKKIIIAIGPAGCGKTLLACNHAIKEYERGVYEKIIITRPVVPVEEDIGYLPGSLIKKMDPWTRPIFDIFLEFYSQKEIDGMIQRNAIEISPLAYMRGRTFKNALIIADEMQNSSPNQMLMLTTRIGNGSKMVITGDLKQRDKRIESGLSDLIEKLENYKSKEVVGIELVKLNSTDIKREAIISTILDIYGEGEVVEEVVKGEMDYNYNYSRIIDEMLAEKSEIEIMFPRINETCIFQKSVRKDGNGDAALMPEGDRPRRDLI